ncbi:MULTISPECIES: YhcN/YlaJ family sporulation lipoprotein [unclassified Bacillus (in: firmicutes)]|uniref:YhcN/YlaJ family sporulation lipoprotein n=1 Tax=unclassified Bacillus (in: firmicutes) TaxID=185979 RepID=UPI0008F41260|nr:MULTISPECIES: YhcN/YlaJ family sporulation lipoprotein [unclassified Bacillus (in: firmicutes)]SFA76197.1 sporulation lipoprotein, YhcN/YlaJ family [Bacillus sp. UNCCL13]SFQ66109.1 sporulation lipoprotein, YhcN/YlaJ family [Bacillus sp. cl95]
MKVFWIVLLFLFTLSGCNTSNNNATESKQQFIKVKNSEIEHVDRKTGVQISKRLVELSTGIPNVNDATAVVLGKYAIVGIDVDSNIERSQVGSIKYSVAESLKKDPYGAKAVVIADPDVTARLKEINQDIKNGQPIQGIMNELADISGRLMPEIPADILKPNPKNGLEEPKNKLNQKEQKKLENKQEKHSNYYK